MRGDDMTIKTLTYGNIPLKVAPANQNPLSSKGANVSGEVNLETGEIKFFLDEKELPKFKRLIN